jgi:transposase
MQYNRIEKPEKLAAAIESRLSQDEEARLYRKLLAVLLVARHPDNNCSEVARQLGYSVHTVARWVRSVCDEVGFDLDGLKEKEKPGRKKRLTADQLSNIKNVIRKPPERKNTKKWTGKLLSAYIFDTFQVELQVRQCQKIIKSTK